MNDRELLELAAKAAGHRLEWHIPKAGSDEPHIEGIDWNPLTDDGDALRLAVAVGIEPCWYKRADYASARAVPPSGHVIRIEEHGGDPYAATRRAIVRAAAEIGRSQR